MADSPDPFLRTAREGCEHMCVDGLFQPSANPMEAEACPCEDEHQRTAKLLEKERTRVLEEVEKAKPDDCYDVYHDVCSCMDTWADAIAALKASSGEEQS